MPFERTTHPGLTVVGHVEVEGEVNLLEISTRTGWQAQVDESVLFPTGLLEDGFLHVSTIFFQGPGWPLNLTQVYGRSASASRLPARTHGLRLYRMG